MPRRRPVSQGVPFNEWEKRSVEFRKNIDRATRLTGQDMAVTINARDDYPLVPPLSPSPPKKRVRS